MLLTTHCRLLSDYQNHLPSEPGQQRSKDACGRRTRISISISENCMLYCPPVNVGLNPLLRPPPTPSPHSPPLRPISNLSKPRVIPKTNSGPRMGASSYICSRRRRPCSFLALLLSTDCASQRSFHALSPSGRCLQTTRYDEQRHLRSPRVANTARFSSTKFVNQDLHQVLVCVLYCLANSLFRSILPLGARVKNLLGRNGFEARDCARRM
jgi:hypothetical protein